MDMTSSKTISLLANQLGPLSDIDIKAMHDLEKLIDKYEYLPDKDFIKILLDIPYIYLIKWFSYSENIKYFFEHNPKFLKEITSKLALASFISIEVKSFKTGEIINVFNHYLAASFYQTYWINLELAHHSQTAKVKCLESLNNACELKFYDALLQRSKHWLSKISSSKENKLEIMKLIKHIKADISILIDFYRGVGFLQASAIMFDLTSRLEKITALTEEQVILKREAINYYLSAILLQDDSASRELAQNIQQGLANNWIFGDTPEYYSIEDLKAGCCEIISESEFNIILLNVEKALNSSFK